MAAMSVFGASRFTALLAAVAISGSACTFWWALQTRADLKAAADSQAAGRGLSKSAGRFSRSKDERFNKDERLNKAEPNKFELMGSSERSQPAPFNPLLGAPGRSENQDQTPDGSSAPRVLANYRPASGPQSGRA